MKNFPLLLLCLLSAPPLQAALLFNGNNNYSSQIGFSAPGGRPDVLVELLSSGLYINTAQNTSGSLGQWDFQTGFSQFSQYDSADNFIQTINYSWGTELPSGFTYRSEGPVGGLFGFTSLAMASRSLGGDSGPLMAEVEIGSPPATLR